MGVAAERPGVAVLSSHDYDASKRLKWSPSNEGRHKTAATPKDSVSQEFCYGHPSVVLTDDPNEPDATPKDVINYGVHAIIVSVGELASVIQTTDPLELPSVGVFAASMALLDAYVALIEYRNGNPDEAIRHLWLADDFLAKVPAFHGPGGCNESCQRDTQDDGAETGGSDA